MTKTDVQMLKNYIGGQWIEAETSQTEAVYNPATGEIIAEVPLSTKKMSNVRYRQHNKHLPLGRKPPFPAVPAFYLNISSYSLKNGMSWLNSSRLKTEKA